MSVLASAGAHMLFHATHIHTAEACPFHDPDRIEATFKKVFAAAPGDVKLQGAWVNAPAHRVHFLVEAGSVDALVDLFAPIIDLGDLETEPVVNAVELTERLTGP